jgi:mannose-6-phosphate isomerase-like protein (cupin superfamily)
MTEYTQLNLKNDVENMAPQFGMPDGIQARFGRRALGSEEIGVTHYTLAPDFRTPFGHRHRTQEEIYVVVSGNARIKVDDDVVELQPWDALRVPAQTTRCMEAGPEGAEVLAFGQAADMDDTEMVPGWWSSEE